MINYLLLAASILSDLFACGILRNQFSKKYVKSNTDLQIFNALSSIISAVSIAVICVCTSGLSKPSPFTILLGIVFGIATALCAILNIKALECGPLSYTKIIISCSMIIPALSGMLFFGEESISVLQYIGILFMIASFICAVDKKNEQAGASLKWLLMCLGAFVFCGSVGVMQKVHQSSVYKNELGSFLIIAFITSAVLSLLTVLLRSEKITVFERGKLKNFLCISLICGIGIAFCNHVNIYLSGVISAIILFPVLNGGSMLLTSAAGLIFWKEKFSKKQYVGLTLGVISILLLCIN